MKKRPYSPYANRNFPERPLFGDTHLHTAISFDAGMLGTTLMPADAYRFAKGEQLIASSGQPVRLSRPLDFLVVTDHSDNFGLASDIVAGAPNVLAVPEGQRWYNMIKEGKGFEAATEAYMATAQSRLPEALNYAPGTRPYRSAWEQTIKAADEANDPGRFTAFIGYEWSSNPGGNLHRNVIFRNDGALARQVEPLTTIPPIGTSDPRGLWEWMQTYESKTGGDVLAIAHNGNLSNGLMFPIIEPVDGKPIDRAYAETRARWEPLFEVTQIKGTSEAHPFLSPTDEFADYEIWDKGNLDLTVAKTNDMLEYEYARAALKNGLKLEETLGVSPYKFGMVGSTDAHTGLAAVEENNYFGKITPEEPSAHRLTNVFQKGAAGSFTGWELSSSGYAAVWATGEHARGHLRCDGAARDVCHDRHAHGRAVFRRLGLRGGRCDKPHAGRCRLHPRCADGRQSQRGAQGRLAALPRRGPARPDRRQPRPYPDRQGMARQGWEPPGAGLRRRLVGRPRARAPTASCRRSAIPSTCRTLPGQTRSARPN